MYHVIKNIINIWKRRSFNTLQYKGYQAVLELEDAVKDKKSVCPTKRDTHHGIWNKRAYYSAVTYTVDRKVH